MKEHSSTHPPQYRIRRKYEKSVLVRLHKNIEEIQVDSEEGPESQYQYDYIDIKIPLAPNVVKYIEENFNALWKAHGPTELHNTIVEAQAAIDALLGVENE